MSIKKQRLFIKKLEIKNVGRFYGSDHSIEFSDSSDKNITIIIGGSGRGKSTIHDMIYWCLYGEYKKDSTTEHTKLDYGLMNSDALENLSKGESVTASVTISIHDDTEQKYLLTRELKATCNKESTTRRFESQNNSNVQSGIDFETKVKLQFKDRYKEMQIEKNHKMIKSEISTYFPQHLSDFFLFDGENLLKFQTDSSSDFIKDGITKISGLEILASMAESAKYTANNIRRYIGGKSANVAPHKAKDASFRDSISEVNKEIDYLEQERDKAQRSHDEISEKIRKNKNGNELIENQKKVQKNKKDALRDLRHIDEQIKNTLFERIPQLLIRDTLQHSEQIFARLEDEDKIPPSISRSAIDKILESHPLRCVCGREFEKNDDKDAPWMILNQIKDTIIEDDISQGISLGRDLISRIIDDSGIKKTKKDYHELIESRRSKRKKIEEFDVEIKDLDQQLKNIQYINDEDLGSQKIKYLAQLVDHESNIRAKKDDLEGLTQDLQENCKRYDEAIEKEKKYDDEGKKISLAEAVNKFSKTLEANIEEIFRKRTEQATNKYFLESAPQKEIFDHVTISPKYDITACDSDGYVKELSKGQSHVLGLSYVSGCRQITNTNTFLFIDSPLHNISGDSRNEISQVLANNLPGVQVVLFVTDSEYTSGDEKGAKPVRHYLNPSNKVWKEYEIQNTIEDEINTKVIREYKRNE